MVTSLLSVTLMTLLLHRPFLKSQVLFHSNPTYFKTLSAQAHGNLAGESEHHQHLLCSIVGIFIFGDSSDNMIKVSDRRPIDFPYWKTKHLWGQKCSWDLCNCTNEKWQRLKKQWKINSTGGLVQHLIKQYLLFFQLCISRLQIKI